MFQFIQPEEKYYTIERLVGCTLKVLNVLSGYEPGATVVKPSGPAGQFLASCNQPWTKMAQSNAIAAAAQKRAGDVWSVAHIEESVWPKGGQVEYSAKEISVSKPNGEVIKVQNNPIPLPPKAESRPGLQTVAVAIASLMDLDKGQIVLIKLATDWISRFPDKNYPINPAGVIRVKSIFSELYDPVWKVPHSVEELTLRGASWVQFLMPFLLSLSELDYWKLATVITTDLFNVVRVKKPDNSWVLVKYTSQDGSAKAFVKSEDLFIPSARARQEMKWPKNYPNPIVIMGPVSTLQYTPGSQGATFVTAVKVMTDSMAFRGGTSRGLGFLCSGLGYAGLPSVNTRRLVMQLSLVIPQMRKGHVVLKVNVADILPIYSAILRWSDVMNLDINRLQYLVPMEDLSKVHKDCKSRCVISPQSDSCFIWVSNAQLPTVKATDETGLVYRNAAQGFFSSIPIANYIIVGPVYAHMFFEKAKIFSIGNAWDFKCIITDHLSVVRSGFENNQETQETLLQIPSAEHLWPMVVRDNGRMIGMLMAPKTSYHSSVNLLQRLPKAGALQMNSEGVWEYGATEINEDEEGLYGAASSDESDEDDDGDIIEEQDDEEQIIPQVVDLPKKPGKEKPKEKEKEVPLANPKVKGVTSSSAQGTAAPPPNNVENLAQLEEDNEPAIKEQEEEPVAQSGPQDFD